MQHTLSREVLLRKARQIWREQNALPLDVAVELMDAGFIVETLEAQWAQENENE